MTADNPGAFVPIFQGNDGIHQSILGSFRARLALPALWVGTAQMQGQRKKQVWHYTAVTLTCRCSERAFIFITHQKLQIYNQTWKPSLA